jgi:predicted DNA-binding transcriptional regulator YafY
VADYAAGIGAVRLIVAVLSDQSRQFFECRNEGSAIRDPVPCPRHGVMTALPGRLENARVVFGSVTMSPNGIVRCHKGKDHRRGDMRYSRAERLIQLALEMQAARGGLTIADIMARFEVSRRTAIRMRDAVIRAFPQADEVPSNDRHKRWRLPGGAVQVLGGITANDLATLEAAGEAFDRLNLHVHAEGIRSLGAKVRAILKDRDIRQIDPDLEALLEAEGLAHRPGPRPRISATTFELLRTAIKSCCKVTFEYASRDGKASRRSVCPLGFLYGHRHYLVARDENGIIKSFSLAAISGLKVTQEGAVRPIATILRLPQ